MVSQTFSKKHYFIRFVSAFLVNKHTLFLALYLHKDDLSKHKTVLSLRYFVTSKHVSEMDVEILRNARENALGKRILLCELFLGILW